MRGRGAHEAYDNPIERIQLLGDDDEAVAAFLDEIEVSSPRERELLADPALDREAARGALDHDRKLREAAEGQVPEVRRCRRVARRRRLDRRAPLLVRLSLAD
jgi:hypothetical protein